ncbi:MAG: hypothetical protein RRY40_00955 [Oscillospiraceae bacterium]
MADDISSMINNVLSNPDAMNQIQEIAKSLGLGDSGNNSQGGEKAAEKGADSMGGFSDAPPQGTAQSTGQGNNAFSGIDLNSVMMIKSAMEKLNVRDENVELLKALKVHFSPKRAKKVDDAIKLLGFLRLLPLLKDSGILGQDGGGKK